MPDRLALFGRVVSVKWITAILMLVMAGYYYALMSNGFHRDLYYPVLHGLAFNSMLDHMLQGRFDVDPKIIGNEAFMHAGRARAYFGLLPAIFRLPLLASGGLLTTDITLISCVAATWLAGVFKIRAVLAAAGQCEESRLRSFAVAALILSIAFGGPQVTFAKPSIYQEVINWDDTFAAAFVYCAIVGLVVRREFSPGLLAAMAVLAGLTLVTRVSTAIGLYAAIGFLVLSIAWRRGDTGDTESGWFSNLFVRGRRAVRAFVSPTNAAVLAILLAFALVCGFVNFERWGNPLEFAPLKTFLMYTTEFPERIAVIDRYGTFNLGRVWYGLMYYFAPIWVFIRPDGSFLFHETQQRLIDAAELPPSSFFLSDPVLVALALFFFFAAARRGPTRAPHSAPLLAGLVLPALLILAFDTMALRYRIEFYPFLTLAGILGLHLACNGLVPRSGRAASWEGPFLLCGAVLGSGVSHLVYVLYVLSPFGPSTVVLDKGWVPFYRAELHDILEKAKAPPVPPKPSAEDDKEGR